VGRYAPSAGAEPLLEDFTGELSDGFSFFLDSLPQGQETLRIHLNLKVASLDVHVEIDGLQEFLAVGDAVRVPELRRLLMRFELGWQRVNLSACASHKSYCRRRLSERQMETMPVASSQFSIAGEGPARARLRPVMLLAQCDKCQGSGDGSPRGEEA
jgi:hypothetical protein